MWLGRNIIIFRNFDFENVQTYFQKIFSKIEIFENKNVGIIFNIATWPHATRGVPPDFLSANRKAYVLKSPNPEGIGMKLISLRERDL